MNNIDRIKDFQKVYDNSEKLLKELIFSLDRMKENMAEYDKLNEYYYKGEWQKDYDDSNKGLIAKEDMQGILSEDAIFDLHYEYNQLALDMMEFALGILKR